MIDTSEKTLLDKCPHCDPQSFALKHILKETDNFWVVCDVHPICEGHILIIPKEHISCVGEFEKVLMHEFILLYSKISQFIQKSYGSVCTFEHGKIGQTVFHSHIHLFPCKTTPEAIVPEGKFKKINSIFQLSNVYKSDNQYLFFTINSMAWVVDTTIGVPRFFRDRFAQVLRNHNRGNWKQMRKSKKLMDKVDKEIKNLKNTWKKNSS